MAMYRSPATRRYLVRLVVLMSIYLVTLFVAVRLFRAEAVSCAAAYALAILPALPSTLFAAIMMPWPLPHRMMPRRQSPEATSRAAALPCCG